MSKTLIEEVNCTVPSLELVFPGKNLKAEKQTRTLKPEKTFNKTSIRIYISLESPILTLISLQLPPLLNVFVCVDENEGGDDVGRNELVVDEDVFKNVGKIVEKMLQKSDRKC